VSPKRHLPLQQRHALQHDSNKAANDLNKLISRRTNGYDERAQCADFISRLFVERMRAEPMLPLSVKTRV
jgi:hypothetical protein